MNSPNVLPFVFEDLRGEIVRDLVPEPAAELAGALRHVIDPASATETLHWGRNYLYRALLLAPGGEIEVVVKQFRNQGLKARLRRRLGGCKAERSWRAARAFEAAGIDTAPPVALIRSTRDDGPSWFVTRYLPGMIEARHLFRAANAGRERDEYPAIDFEAFLDRLGRTLRRLHEAGLFHRDLSIGNVLLRPEEPERLFLIDLNRVRRRSPVGLSARTRDLCRLAIFRREHRRRFLRAYWADGDSGSDSGGDPGRLRTALYLAYHHGFLFKIGFKKRWRGLWGATFGAVFGRLLAALRPRRAHVHMPPPPEDATARDKIVWDYLSDQPHQHAGRWEKLRVRLADAPSHLRRTAAFLRAAPAIRRRYRELRRDLYRRPLPWTGVGVAVRPWPAAPDELLRALDDLGARHVLVRLHPWQDRDDDELALARELHGRGFDLAFALPQNRDLVREPGRWRRRLEEIAERFTPYGRHFQVGQAINRSKWGVWRTGEYFELAAAAAEVLRRHPGVEVLGPSVIDFEVHVTAGVLHLPGCPRFDALASLLYVDRRGAPERTQLGFDTVGKVTLLRALAETAPSCGPRSWITEVNWPLWEGPHSPAGKSVSVDEATQADYLARFYLLALATGLVERVYWWQLIARGYGLISPEDAGLRRRPSYHALATLGRELRGAAFLAPLPAPAGTFLYRFRRAGGGEIIAGWSAGGERQVTLPGPPESAVGRDGEDLPAAGATAVLTSSVRYFRFAGEG